MKIKPMNDIEQSVETYITGACGVSYTVVCTGLHKRDNWECDGWRFTLCHPHNEQSFDYFTGLGNREAVNSDIRQRAAFGFQGLTDKDRKGLTSYGRRYLEQVQKLRKPQTPPIAGLLHSLIMDGSACNESFASWCDSFGYDTDSRKARETYEQCQQGFDKLRKVLTATQIEHVRELLEDY